MAFVQVVKHIWGRKWTFLFTFVGVLFATYILLFVFNLDPTPRPTQSGRIGSNVQNYPIEAPAHIEIPKVGVASVVLNPTDPAPAKLDLDLAKGAIQYPGSPNLGEQANVLLFGHSSYLPIVHNQAYRAFNEIQNLVAGDEIYVYGQKYVYIYKVLEEHKANSLATEIPLEATGYKLTLVTCDTFEAKTDRFIVTAELDRVALLEQGSN